MVTCFPSISRALRVSSGNVLRPPLTSSLRKHSGQKPRARQRAWPGYGAIPCTLRAVTRQIPGAAGRSRSWEASYDGYEVSLAAAVIDDRLPGVQRPPAAGGTLAAVP